MKWSVGLAHSSINSPQASLRNLSQYTHSEGRFLMKRSNWGLIVILLVVVYATRAYASTGDSENMSLVGRWAGGPAYEGDVVGTVTYWGNGAYLEIYDFANPAAPAKLGRVLLARTDPGCRCRG